MRIGVVAGVRQLMKDAVAECKPPGPPRTSRRSSPRHISPVAFHDEVNLLLLLVVPRHLAAVRFQRHLPHGEIRGLDGADAAHQVLRAAARRIRPAGDLREIRDDHDFLLSVTHYPAARRRFTCSTASRALTMASSVVDAGPTESVLAKNIRSMGREASGMVLV